MMVACGQMAQTIFVPALADITASFHASPGQLQAIMVFLVMLALNYAKMGSDLGHNSAST